MYTALLSHSIHNQAEMWKIALQSQNIAVVMEDELDQVFVSAPDYKNLVMVVLDTLNSFDDIVTICRKAKDSLQGCSVYLTQPAVDSSIKGLVREYGITDLVPYFDDSYYETISALIGVFQRLNWSETLNASQLHRALEGSKHLLEKKESSSAKQESTQEFRPQALTEPDFTEHEEVMPYTEQLISAPQPPSATQKRVIYYRGNPV